MARTKKPKVEIKRYKSSLGWVYRIYIGGMYMAAAPTQEAARKSADRMLAIYRGQCGLGHRLNDARKLSAITASAKHQVT